MLVILLDIFQEWDVKLRGCVYFFVTCIIYILVISATQTKTFLMVLMCGDYCGVNGKYLWKIWNIMLFVNFLPFLDQTFAPYVYNVICTYTEVNDLTTHSWVHLHRRMLCNWRLHKNLLKTAVGLFSVTQYCLFWAEFGGDACKMMHALNVTALKN